MEPTVEIKAEEVYPCPFCGRKYATKEEALNCFRAFKWNEEFPADDYLWKWCIFALPSNTNRVVAIIPNRVDKSYYWSDSDRCTKRPVSLFNSFYNNYYNIYKDTTVLRLGFLEAYERYCLLPPVHYMHDMPFEVFNKAKRVLQAALERRKRELLNSDMSANQRLEAIAAYEFEEFSSPVDTLFEGKIHKMGRFIDSSSYIPETKIISGEQLSSLEKYSPELTLLVQANMDAHKPDEGKVTCCKIQAGS